MARKRTRSSRNDCGQGTGTYRLCLLTAALLLISCLLAGCGEESAASSGSSADTGPVCAEETGKVFTGETAGPEDQAFVDSVIHEAANGGPGSDPGYNPFAGRDALVWNEDGTCSWNGETYKRKSYVKAILCIGVDRSDDLSREKETTWGGQADGIFLLAYDTSAGRLKIVMIPRDTITEVDQTDEKGNIENTWLTHLNLAYAWGDGRHVSAKNTVKAVSGTLCGLEIDHYVAADMKLIAPVNDRAGGVTVKIPNAELVKLNPLWTEGTEVFLNGEDAEKFIRYRDTSEDGTPVTRMTQHKAYISGFSKKIREEAEKNTNIIAEIYDIIEKEIVTDLDKGSLLKLGMDAAADESFGEESVTSLNGTVITREYDEVYLDYSQVIPVVLDLFYRKLG